MSRCERPPAAAPARPHPALPRSLAACPTSRARSLLTDRMGAVADRPRSRRDGRGGPAPAAPAAARRQQFADRDPAAVVASPADRWGPADRRRWAAPRGSAVRPGAAGCRLGGLAAGQRVAARPVPAAGSRAEPGPPGEQAAGGGCDRADHLGGGRPAGPGGVRRGRRTDQVAAAFSKLGVRPTAVGLRERQFAQSSPAVEAVVAARTGRAGPSRTSLVGQQVGGGGVTAVFRLSVGAGSDAVDAAQRGGSRSFDAAGGRERAGRLVQSTRPG